jgi:hypothetical protein
LNGLSACLPWLDALKRNPNAQTSANSEHCVYIGISLFTLRVVANIIELAAQIIIESVHRWQGIHICWTIVLEICGGLMILDVNFPFPAKVRLIAIQLMLGKEEVACRKST